MLGAYGIDTLDPKVSMRRMFVLLERMPPAARRIGEVWSDESELLALLIDHVAELTWVTARAAGSTQPRPQPLRRPPRHHRAIRADGPPPGWGAAPPEGQRPAGSLAEALGMIAAMDGMVVTHDAELRLRLADRQCLCRHR